MNLKSVLTLSLTIIPLSFSTLAFAGMPVNKPKPDTETPISKPKPVGGINSGQTKPAAGECKVCAQWAKGQPGTFTGACIRYEYRPCGISPVIH